VVVVVVVVVVKVVVKVMVVAVAVIALMVVVEGGRDGASGGVGTGFIVAQGVVFQSECAQGTRDLGGDPECNMQCTAACRSQSLTQPVTNALSARRTRIG
jgi:hypothetical protein